VAFPKILLLNSRYLH